MPTYVYRREDGSTFELEQRITAPALETCPTTGQRVKRVISGAGLIFKGQGFYLTDYARSGSDKTKESKSDSDKSTTTEAATDSGKPAEKAPVAKPD